MSEEHPDILDLPLFCLHYLDDPSEFVELKPERIKGYQEDYTPEELEEIWEALRWAVNHPDYDFRKVLPNSRYTSAEIYQFIEAVYTGFFSFMVE